jgi:excisionase family DNA binding protein
VNAKAETMAFLHAHGLEGLEPKALNASLRSAIAKLKALYYPTHEQGGLTAAELEVARAGGLDPTPRFLPGDDPLLAGAIRYASLLQTGLTTTQAAKLLGVSDARIRQRLQDRTLLAIREGRSWKLPVFQFAGKGELPGWGEVAQAFPGDVSMVAVESWLLLPNTDLVTGADETPTSPRAWLLEGRSSQPVAVLAAQLS